MRIWGASQHSHAPEDGRVDDDERVRNLLSFISLRAEGAIGQQQVAEERRDALMATQQEIAFAFNAAQTGNVLDVLIDRRHPEESNVWIGRTYADAPDIDGLVFVTGENLQEGQICPCEIVTSQGYDLIAVPANSNSQRKKE